MKAVCRHCRNHATIKGRGLCWRCIEQPYIREAYQTESKYGRRGVALGGRLSDSATLAAPGTVEKIAVMAQRASTGFSLFHPRDAEA